MSVRSIAHLMLSYAFPLFHKKQMYFLVSSWVTTTSQMLCLDCKDMPSFWDIHSGFSEFGHPMQWLVQNGSRTRAQRGVQQKWDQWMDGNTRTTNSNRCCRSHLVTQVKRIVARSFTRRKRFVCCVLNSETQNAIHNLYKSTSVCIATTRLIFIKKPMMKIYLGGRSEWEAPGVTFRLSVMASFPRFHRHNFIKAARLLGPAAVSRNFQWIIQTAWGQQATSASFHTRLHLMG